jgi:hypothetical protein
MRALKWLPVGVAVAIATGVAVADVGGLTGGAGGGTTITDTLALTGTTVTNLITSATTNATATASVAALTVKPANTLDSGDLIFDIQTSTGTSVFKVNKAGATTATSTLTVTAGDIVDSGGDVQGQILKSSVNTIQMTSTTVGSISSSTSAANASTTAAAFQLKPQNALDANDLVVDVRSSADAHLLTVDQEGDAIVGGALKVSSTTGGGTISLSGGTGTATVLSGHRCVCTDTTANASVKCAVSGTTLTATGTTTDVIAYFCF